MITFHVIDNPDYLFMNDSSSIRRLMLGNVINIAL